MEMFFRVLACITIGINFGLIITLFAHVVKRKSEKLELNWSKTKMFDKNIYHIVNYFDKLGYSAFINSNYPGYIEGHAGQLNVYSRDRNHIIVRIHSSWCSGTEFDWRYFWRYFDRVFIECKKNNECCIDILMPSDEDIGEYKGE